MSNIEKRLEIMDEASKAPVTKKGAEKALIETGIIDKKGNILPPYNLVFTKVNQVGNVAK